MTVIAAYLYAGLCGLTVLFLIAVICGAPWGALTQGGRWPGTLPPLGRVLAAVSAGVLVWCALAILGAAGIGPDWPYWTGWVAAAIAVLSAVMNLITPSRAERALWGPVCVVMAVLAVLVMTTG